MPNPKDLSSQFDIPIAEKELEILVGVQESGQRSDGVSPFANIFGRGQGETVFSIVGTGITVSAVEGARTKGGFGSIQLAIDWAGENGGGIVRIPSGTHNVDSEIVIPSNTKIVGEDRDSTIIDFSGATLSDGGIVTEGASLSSTGTVAVASSKVVTGTDTLFVSHGAQTGDYLVINSIPYQIESVASETSMVLSEWLTGGSVAGVPTSIYRLAKNIGVSNLSVVGDGGSNNGININFALNASVQNLSVLGASNGINIGRVFNAFCAHNICKHNVTSGVRVGDVVGGSIFSNYIFNNGTSGSNRSGILCSSTGSDSAVISQNTVIANGGDGILLFLSDNVTLTNNIVQDNDAYGIFAHSSANNVITGNMIKDNGGSGIVLDDAGIPGPDSDDNLIASNMCITNGGWGIEIFADQNGNLIHGNFNDTNSSGAIDDNGTANSVVDNYS